MANLLSCSHTCFNSYCTHTHTIRVLSVEKDQHSRLIQQQAVIHQHRNHVLEPHENITGRLGRRINKLLLSTNLYRKSIQYLPTFDTILIIRHCGLAVLYTVHLPCPICSLGFHSAVQLLTLMCSYIEMLLHHLDLALFWTLLQSMLCVLEQNLHHLHTVWSNRTMYQGSYSTY